MTAATLPALLLLPLLLLLSEPATLAARVQHQVIRRPSLVCLVNADIGDLSCRVTVANLTVAFNDLGTILRSVGEAAPSGAPFDRLHLRVQSSEPARLQAGDIERVAAATERPVRQLALLSPSGLTLAPCSLPDSLQRLTLSTVASGLGSAFCPSSVSRRLQRLSLRVADQLDGRECRGLSGFLTAVLPSLQGLRLGAPSSCPAGHLSVVGAEAAPHLAELTLSMDLAKLNQPGAGPADLDERLKFAGLPRLASLRLSLAAPCARGFAFGAGAFADLPKLERLHLKVLVTGAGADGHCSLLAPGAFAANSTTMRNIRLTAGVQSRLGKAGGSLRLNLTGANAQLLRCHRSADCPDQRVELLASGRFRLLLPPDAALAENATELRLAICRPPWRQLQLLMAPRPGRRLVLLVVERPPGWGRQPAKDDDEESDGFEGGVCGEPDEQPEESLDIGSALLAAAAAEGDPAATGQLTLSLWAELCVCKTSIGDWRIPASVRLTCANLDAEDHVTSAAEACDRLEIADYARRVRTLSEGSRCGIHNGFSLSCSAGTGGFGFLADPPLPPATRHLDLRFGGRVSDESDEGSDFNGTEAVTTAAAAEIDEARLSAGGFLRNASGLRSLLLLGSRQMGCPRGLVALEDGALDGAAGLEHLALRHHPIRRLGSGAFAKLTRLRSLDLRFNCHLKLVDSGTLRPALPSLLRLHLPDALEPGALASAKRLRHLELSLFERDRPVWEIPAGFVADLPALRSLAVLVGRPWRTLRLSAGSLANLPSLRSLVLRVITHRGGRTELPPGALVNLSGSVRHIILDGVDLLSFGADQLVELTRESGGNASQSGSEDSAIPDDDAFDAAEPELQLELLTPLWYQPSDSLLRFLPSQPVKSTRSLALRLAQRPCKRKSGLTLSELSDLLAAFPRLRRFSLSGCVALASEAAAGGAVELAKRALAAAPQLERLDAPAPPETCQSSAPGEVALFNYGRLRMSLACEWPWKLEQLASSSAVRRVETPAWMALAAFAVRSSWLVTA